MISVAEFGRVTCETLQDNDPCDGQACMWNTRCHVTCTQGYSVPAGDRSYLVCLENGQWDAPVSVCEGKTY